ncbi:MAG: hypothetical protein KC493_12845, partial [Bacteriovoracaceae bacterium]|nr:hypothetical protein [Bacteriovoracaceae bacterium]
IELLELNPLFQENLPPVGGYYAFESETPLFLFLPLNTQEFFIEGLLGGGKGELSGFQGTGLLGKKAIESMISSIVELSSNGFESLKEFELTLLTHRLFELKLNLVSEKSYQISIWIGWDQRKKILEKIGVEVE